MKKSIVLGLFSTLLFNANAQVEVTTKSVELEPLNKHKVWRIIEAGRTSSNEIYLKFGKPGCDVSRSSWTGSSTYRGLSWNIDKLIFNSSFEYQKTEAKTYSTSEEAVLQNENVFGKSFMPISNKGIGGLITSSTGMPPRKISNKFLFNNIVVPAASFGGVKIKTSYITCGPIGATCSEVPYIMDVNTESAKEAKGQQWIPTYNNPEPNGGNILFGTSGVNPDDTKVHYVFRKYNDKGTVIVDKAFTFDYQCLMSTKEIETAPGVFDYIFVTNTINYKKSKAVLAPANQYEYIRVDGKNFEIKERIKFEGVYTKWTLDEVIEENGALYIMGACGNSATEHMGFYVTPKEKEGFQIAKIKDGKLEYIKAFTEKEAEAAIKIPEGLKGKVDVGFQFMNMHLYVKNGRIVYEGQSLINNKFKAIVNIVIGVNGDLETIIAQPFYDGASYSTHFSKDGNTLYWILGDAMEYNKYDNGVFYSKKAREVVNAIGVVKYDMNAKSAVHQNLMNDDWAVLYTNPLLYESDSEIVLNGIKLSKKAKESEAIFVMIKK
jgi:hypothetical protein